MKSLRLFSLLCLIPLLLSCSAKINGSVSHDGSAVFSVEMSLGQRISSMIRSLNSAGGQDEGTILDAQALNLALTKEGISTASFRNTGPAAVDGQIRISNINEFLYTPETGRFFSFEQGQTSGSCRISINIENGPAFVKLLSPEISDYLDALMAPVSTGEVMNKSEYLDLITTFYNRNISNEIANSRILASIEFPAVISGVRGGTFNRRTAEFDILLLDFLVLETPLIFEVTWNYTQ